MSTFERRIASLGLGSDLARTDLKVGLAATDGVKETDERKPDDRRTRRSDRRRRDRHRDRRVRRRAGPRSSGKRVSARFFQEEVLPHGAEACNYLLSVDVDMNTVDGYAMSSWETGYGDMMLLPDPRPCGASRGCPARALVMADLAWESGDPVVQSPRDILKRQRAPPRRPRTRRLLRHRARVHRLRRHVSGCLGHGYRDLTPSTDYNVDYDLLASSRLEPLLRDIRRRWTARASTARASRASATSGSRRSPSATPRCSRPPISTRSTRTARRRSPTSTARRSPSWRSSTSARATAATSTCRCATTSGRR